MIMQTKINDRSDFIETDNLPVLDTPHFDAHEIAQAKPVQPLAAPLRQRRAKPMPRMISFVVIVAGFVVTVALATAFINANPLLRSASDDAASKQFATEQSAANASSDLSEKTQPNTTRDNKQRKLPIRRIERPRTIIIFGDADDRKRKARLVSVIQ
jgi:hypothetical protein